MAQFNTCTFLLSVRSFVWKLNFSTFGPCCCILCCILCCTFCCILCCRVECSVSSKSKLRQVFTVFFLKHADAVKCLLWRWIKDLSGLTWTKAATLVLVVNYVPCLLLVKFYHEALLLASYRSAHNRRLIVFLVDRVWNKVKAHLSSAAPVSTYRGSVQFYRVQELNTKNFVS